MAKYKRQKVGGLPPQLLQPRYTRIKKGIGIVVLVLGGA